MLSNNIVLFLSDFYLVYPTLNGKKVGEKNILETIKIYNILREKSF